MGCNMEFKDRLMELRKSKGWSQEDLGYQLDVTRQTVSKWELGQTTPEMSKLVILSELFDVSLDELITGSEHPGNTYTGNEQVIKNEDIYIEKKRHYEYKSNTNFMGIPLIHINMGYGLYRAKGIIAIGNIATGVISLGIISFGIISFGAVALGLFALAGLASGLFAIGGVAAGGLAAGGVAIGYLAAGGLAIGVYSIGGCAIADKIALGGYARGTIAVGDKVKGTVTFLMNNYHNVNAEDLKSEILDQYPNIWKVILKLFTSIVS